MTAVTADRDRLEVIWHDVECGSYRADLALWARLADEAAAPILDLGCGTGRVALHLARRGHRVTGLDLRRELVAELARRAARASLTSLSAVQGDARSLDLDRAFGLVIAPMQLLQVLGRERERAACLRGIAAHLAPGGLAAVAIVTSSNETAPGHARPLPDVREVDGWIYSSLPTSVCRADDGLIVSRLRQVVSPGGGLTDEQSHVSLSELAPATLEAEAANASLRLTRTVELPASEDHVGSTVAIMEAS